jgi:putative ABC transport system ATP-binding protein
MNQIKIGNFIATRRKAHGMTQSQLAEKLGITDKAVSKWETGKSMPDLSLFTPLCDLLEITLNELLLGEFITDDNLREKSNQVLFEVITSWLGKDQWEYHTQFDAPHIVLKLQNLKKIYNTENTSTLAVNNVSLEVSKGSFVGIMGASGSGKSTLLNMIATIDKATSGIIEISGQNIAKLSEKDLSAFRREHLGFIFQEYNLLDTLTIYENITLALTIKQTPKESVKHIIYELAEKLEISDILSKFPYEVSGGQRQRCACARAIAVNPSLILADEPTGALDSHSAKQLLETLVMFRRDYSATILMVTHDAFSASYCDKILFMQDGDIKAVLDRGEENKHTFFANILDVMARLTEGGSYVY